MTTPTNAPNFATAIACGMAWLDEHHPGWEEKIDLETLNLGGLCDCVLGQLEKGYATAMRRIARDVLGQSESKTPVWWSNLDKQAAWSNAHGFCMTLGNTRQYEQLTAAWKTAITQRLATR